MSTWHKNQFLIYLNNLTDFTTINTEYYICIALERHVCIHLNNTNVNEIFKYNALYIFIKHTYINIIHCIHV